MPFLIRLAAFQLGWFACIWCAAQGAPWVGPLVVACIVAAHVELEPARGRESLWIAFAAALGYLADSLLVLAGILSFPSQATLGSPSTIWMVALWANFAVALRSLLAWLHGRYLVGALLGAAAGPASYYAGAALGAVELTDPPSSLAAVAVEWALATPLLLAVSQRLASAHPAAAQAKGVHS